jgi:hypothetical protein
MDEINGEWLRDSDYPWLVIENTSTGQNVKCERCGCILMIRLPVPLMKWSRELKSFSAIHKDCP